MFRRPVSIATNAAYVLSFIEGKVLVAAPNPKARFVFTPEHYFSSSECAASFFKSIDVFAINHMLWQLDP